jgi:N-hydroxyarylamine O-acetyltransferase
MNADRYLQHIGVTKPVTPDLAALAELQQRHLLSVPFENLSVIHREPIVLDEGALFAKIVERRRGGFCYELNGLFAWLLHTLGYRVDRVSAQVYSGSRQRFGPPFDHMALVVHLDRPYLVDVGFGDSARTPIPLPTGVTQDVSGVYRVVETADEYLLEQQAPEGWIAKYRFGFTAYSLADYAPMCLYHSTSPDSHFTRGWVCTLATPDGRLTVTTDELIITTNGHKTRTPISPEHRRTLLHDTFGIDLSGIGQPSATGA